MDSKWVNGKTQIAGCGALKYINAILIILKIIKIEMSAMIFILTDERIRNRISIGIIA